MLDEVKWLTNATLDPSDDWQESVDQAGLDYDEHSPHPLTMQEQLFVSEGGQAIPNVQFADLILGHTGVLRGKKVFLPCVEFHFRNDATRHVWGTPVTLEIKLPSREAQLEAAISMRTRLHPKLEKIGGDIQLSCDQYEQTKDRHILWFALPAAWVCETFDNWGEFVAFLKGCCC